MKRMMMAVVAMASLSAFAKLGESNTEIAKRYGPVQSRKDDSADTWSGVYQFKEYKIVVFFETNRCVAEAVRPVEKRKMSAAERDSLMTAIGGEGKWINAGGLEIMGSTFVNSTNKNVARFEEKVFGPDTLIVATKGFIDRKEAEKKKEDKAKADGF